MHLVGFRFGQTAHFIIGEVHITVVHVWPNTAEHDPECFVTSRVPAVDQVTDESGHNSQGTRRVSSS